MKGKSPDLKDCAGATISHEGGSIVVHLPEFGEPADDFSTLVHESVHVFQKIMHEIGEDEPGYEIEAYSIQNIFSTLLNEYARQKELSDALHDQRKEGLC